MMLCRFPADDLDVLASAQQRAASRPGLKGKGLPGLHPGCSSRLCPVPFDYLRLPNNCLKADTGISPMGQDLCTVHDPCPAARPDWQNRWCHHHNLVTLHLPAAPAKDVLLPAFLEEQESARLIDLLYVADFLTQFGRVLGIQALTLVQLQQLLGLQSMKAALELQQPPQGSPSPVPAQAGAVQEPDISAAPAEGKQGSETPPQGRAGSQRPALPCAAARQQDQAPSSSPAPAGEYQEPQAPQKAAMKIEAEPSGFAAGHRARQTVPELENDESSSGRPMGSTKMELLNSEHTDVVHVKVETLQQPQVGLPRQHINGFAQHASGLASHQQQQRNLKLEHAPRAAVGVQEGNGLLYEDGSRSSIKQAGKLISGPGEGSLALSAEDGQSPVMPDLPADEGRIVPMQQGYPSAAGTGQAAVQQMHLPAVEGIQSPAQQLHLRAAERKQSPGQQLHLPDAEGRQAPQKQQHNPASESLRQQPSSVEVRPAADEEMACPQPQWLWKVYQGLLSHLLPVSCGDCMLCLWTWRSGTSTGSSCTVLPAPACSSVQARLAVLSCSLPVSCFCCTLCW